MNIAVNVKFLKRLSLAYLAMPVFIFMAGWLQLPLAIIGIICLGCALAFWAKKIENDYFVISINQIIALIIIAFGWVAFSGAGGMGLSVPDLNKHLSIYKDLMQQGMPVVYHQNSNTYYLAAYLGYYLPIPIIFGTFGFKVVMAAQFCWTLLGVLLGMSWFGILVQNFKWYIFIVFIFIGGFDILGFFDRLGIVQTIEMLSKDFFNYQPFWANDLDQNLRLIYHGNTHDLYWSPQHGVFNLLLCGMFFYDVFKKQNIVNTPIYLVLGLFWSPLILVGILPIFFSQLNYKRLLDFFVIEHFLIIPVAICIILFVNAVPVANLQKGIIFYPAERKLYVLIQVLNYLKFVMYEVGIWLIFLLIFAQKVDLKLYKKQLVFVFVLLLLIPLYRLGKWNDFVQRVSMPSIYALFLLVFLMVKNMHFKVKIMFIFLVFISSWDAIYHISLSVKITNGRFKYTVRPTDQIDDFLVTTQKEKWPLAQSFATENSLFFKYLAKKKVGEGQ